jgi:PhnB protein
MPSRLNPYLSFKDNARQAMEFYRSVFGGELSISTFADYHASEDPAEADKIMHAQLEAPNGIIVMAADTPNTMEYNPGANIALALFGEDEAELRGYWDRLSPGGMVIMPLEPAPWGDTYGMLTDQFGVQWMVNISPPRA